MGRHTIRLRGYNTDSGDFVEGALKAGTSDVVPFKDGFKVPRYRGAYPSTTSIGTVSGAFAVETLANDIFQRIFVTTGVTPSRIHEYAQSKQEWTNVSKSASTYLGASITEPWCFTSFMDKTIAVQINNTAQGSINPSSPADTPLFSDITAGPQARFCETVGQFVFVANTATSTTQWVCSGLGDATIWTPSVTTQCATGELSSAPGSITGIKRLGNDIVIYKRRSMFLGRYVGASNNTWAFEQVPGNTGALNNRLIVDVGYAHIFMAEDDVYLFDGTRPVALHAPIINHFDVNGLSILTNKASTDPWSTCVDFQAKIIYFIFGGSSSYLPLALYYGDGPNALSWGVLSASGARIGATIYRAAAIFNSAQTSNLVSLEDSATGIATALGTFAMQGIGDTTMFRTLLRVTPKWLAPPSSATGTLGIRNNAATSTGIASAGFSDRTFVGDTSSPTAPDHLDVLSSGRIFDLSFSAKSTRDKAVYLSELTVEFEDDGTE